MRSRFWFGPLLLGLVVLSTRVSAEEGNADLKEVLTRWTETSANIRTFDAKVKVWQYDFIFSECRQSEGRFYFQAPSKALMEFKSVEVAEKGKVINHNGRPFSLCSRTEDTVRLVWTESELLFLQPIDGICLRLPLPTQPISEKGFFFQFPARPQTVLPFVVDLRRDELEREFEFTVTGTDDKFVRMRVTPRQVPHSMRFDQVRLIVDRQKWITTTIEITESAKTGMRTFALSDVKLNEPLAETDKPLEPDLEGWRQLR